MYKLFFFSNSLLPMVVGVSNYYLLLNSETEPMRRVELTLAWSQLTKLASDLHRVEAPLTRPEASQTTRTAGGPHEVGGGQAEAAQARHEAVNGGERTGPARSQP